MTISDANPLQFWLNGVETFNEKVAPGIQPLCYYDIFETTDHIKLQVVEAVAPSLTLIVVDQFTNLITDIIDFTKVGTLFSIDFLPSASAYDYTNTKVKFYIYYGAAGWANFGTADGSWNATPAVSLTGYFKNSNYRRHLLQGKVGDTVHIDWAYTTNKASGAYLIEFKVGFMDATGVPTIDVAVDDTRTSNGSSSGSVDFVLTAPCTYIYFMASTDDAGAPTGVKTTTVTQMDVTGLLIVGAIFDETFALARTITVDIQDTQPDTFLIKYSNQVNYAGLDFSADTVFGLRVKAKFFEERYPTETESEAQSDGEVVSLSNTIKTQRNLEVDAVPLYMHKKISYILNCNTVYIDGLYWTREENYALSKLNDMFALFLGKVFLTLKNNSFMTNVFGSTTSV